MEFNKLVSLVLGFIVLILVFVWISNRVRSSQTVSDGQSVTVTVSPSPTPTEEEEGTTWNPFAFLFNRDGSPTPTPSQNRGGTQVVTGSPTTTPIQIRVVENANTSGGGEQNQAPQQASNTYTNNVTGEVQQIPETGASTLILPLSLAVMGAGVYLRRRS